MPSDDRDTGEELAPREREHLRARDRKRATRMVVDNAGVKRTMLALARQRGAAKGPAREPDQT